MKSEDILPLGRKAITNLDSVKKQWHYSADKGHIVRAMVFPVVMYGCESWTIKKAEWQWIDAFKLWCWRVPWRASRSNPADLWIQSTMNTLWKDWCWTWNSSILIIWFEQLIHWIRPWCWERWRAEGEEGIRGWGGWMASLMQWTWTWAHFGRWWGTERPGLLQSTGVCRATKSWRRLGDWITTIKSGKTQMSINW